MKWGIMADIHANKYALQAVLEKFEERGVKRLAVLGDIVGGGPHPEEVIQTVRSVANVCVIGDHDLHVLGRTTKKVHTDELHENFRKTSGVLSKESMDWLGKRPRVSYWREHMFVHATPFNCFYGDILQASPTMREKLAYGTAFCGHTHEPMLIRNGERQEIEVVTKLKPKDIVVVGSTGWPLKNSLTAHAAVWDTKEGTIEFLQAEYDIDSFLIDARENGFDLFEEKDF